MSDENTSGDNAASSEQHSETEGAEVEQRGPAEDVELWKQRSRQWERQSKDNATAAKERDALQAKLKEFEEASKTDHERQLDKAIKEAEERTRKEALITANTRLVRASVRVAAAGKLNDPEDAIRFLNLDEFKVDDEGEVDSKQIESALEDLLKSKPYLAVKPTKPQGNVDQGVRDSKTKDDNVIGTSRMARAYADAASKKS